MMDIDEILSHDFHHRRVIGIFLSVNKKRDLPELADQGAELDLRCYREIKPEDIMDDGQRQSGRGQTPILEKQDISIG